MDKPDILDVEVVNSSYESERNFFTVNFKLIVVVNKSRLGYNKFYSI